MNMTTGEVASLCNVSVRTIQYYDKKGIISPSNKTENNRRLYTEDELNKIRVVLALKDMGFSLKEIKELLNSNQSINTLNLLLEEKTLHLEESIKNNKELLEQIKFAKKNISKDSEFPVSNILNLQKESGSYQEMQEFRKKFLGVAMIAGIFQYSSIFTAILKKKWKPILIAYPLLMIYAAIATKKYYAVTMYLCPNCQNKFKPLISEWILSNHTYKTRKLECPHCRETSYCIEIHK